MATIQREDNTERPVHDNDEERRDIHDDWVRRDITSESELPGEDPTEGPRSGD